MAETLVETRICDACGADVRPGSMFCYNCGGSVSAESDNSRKKEKKTKVSNAWFKEEIAENNDLKTTRLDKKTEEKTAEEPEELEKSEDLEENDSEVTNTKSGIQEEAKLKSAASLRRKAKTFQRKKVEVVWEESENTPGAWFVLIALILVLFVVLIFWAAIYLK